MSEVPQLTEEKYNRIISSYEKKTQKSKKIYEEAKKYASLGVHHYLVWHRPYPFFVKKAQGSRVFDVDGNEYVDLVMTMGLGILGHNPPKVREKTVKVIEEYGPHPGLCTELAVEWAKKVNKLFPSCDKIKAVNSGTEATMLAVRLARAYTGRNKIVKFQGHYHGWNDVLFYDVFAAGSGTIFSKGIPENHWENIMTVPPNDMDSLENAIKENEIAAVIMEPLGQTTGGSPFKYGFQKEVRELTKENDILLIFDEVVTGFRVALGGAQKILGIRPDITIFGKGVGGGFPIGAVGGNDNIMGMLGVMDPKSDRYGPHYVISAGTFCANPIAMAAGIATMEELEKGDYIKNANLRAEELAQRLKEVGEDLEVNFSANNVYSVIHFGPKRETSGPAITDAAQKLAARLRRGLDELEFNQMIRPALLLNNPGVVILPSHGYTSGVHTKEDIYNVISAFENCLRIYKE